MLASRRVRAAAGFSAIAVTQTSHSLRGGSAGIPSAAMSGTDISGILEGWPYQSGRLQVRLERPEGGVAYLQIRLEMGLVQMRLDGRPDGRSVGAEGTALAQALSSEEPLSTEACQALRDEAAQFHQRSSALYAVEHFEGAAEDAQRSLESARLMRDRAVRAEDRGMAAGPIGPLLVLRTRARAARAVAGRDPRGAAAEIDVGLAELRAHFVERGQGAAFERSGEFAVMRAMRDMLVPRLPASQRSELEDRLRSAVAAENYELAAILRNELRQIRD